MPLLEDPQHRFASWIHCYNAFGDENLNNNQKALHLAFYSASWGMYRGSSGLLWKDYTIHEPIIKELNKYKSLRENNNSFDIDASLLLKLKKFLNGYFDKKEYHKKGKQSSITLTDTLFSKIILGTLGCLPAFDNYFIKGLKYMGYPTIKNINFQTLLELNKITQAHQDKLLATQKAIKDKTGIFYPYMKILDMLCWQLGYEQK